MSADRTFDLAEGDLVRFEPVAGSRSQAYSSWGRFPDVRHSAVFRLHPDEGGAAPFPAARPLLPRGFGRSYGDSCLNGGGFLLDCTALRACGPIDEATGIIVCGGGLSLSDLLDDLVPRGWFLPVVPGTAAVSVGGAIANDIHGKNHHRAGTFGGHVEWLELLRSDGTITHCSRTERTDLFAATIGGLGLTGVILRAAIRLRRVHGPWIDAERVRFTSFDQYFDLSEESDESFEYTVSWVDCQTSARGLGRGVFFRGSHSPRAGDPAAAHRRPRLRIPIDLPWGVVNPTTIRIFNALYYRVPPGDRRASVAHYRSFFFPLDGIANWNRLYGSGGFLQYQFAVPGETRREVVREVVERIRRAGAGSSLVVLKEFGGVGSPGLLSFPLKGTTLAIDLPIRGPRTFRLLDELDRIVAAAGGAVYPAKDARMSPAAFEAFFPRWRELQPFIDPAFSSSFWRRVTEKPGIS